MAVTLEALDLAALLCSRVCHDLISPAGAIVNGLEVLEESKDEETKTFALNLIKKSARFHTTPVLMLSSKDGLFDRARGAMVGHGGIVVFDDTVDMAKQARFAMEFCAIESCGKCTPCRIGSTRGVETIDKIRSGEGVKENIALVEDLCNTMKFGSLCALGGFTPYPVMSALKHFREDFGPAPTRLQAVE